MTSSSQSIIIEDSPEKECYTEELAIDALKIDLITNLNIQLVQYLFKTKIEVKDKNNHKTGKKLVRLESHSAYSLAKSIVNFLLLLRMLLGNWKCQFWISIE